MPYRAYLDLDGSHPGIISSTLDSTQERKLLDFIQQHRSAIGWTLEDIKGIEPHICSHRIDLELESRSCRQPQRRLNPVMQEVVREEILKLLDAGIIYSVPNSEWVSPIHVVPKKAGLTIVKNANNEDVATRVPTKWRVFIDYRRLNLATKKDHFPLPFMDQMLKRLAGHFFYCFLDGYSGYNQIPIHPEDQSKTT